MGGEHLFFACQSAMGPGTRAAWPHEIFCASVKETEWSGLISLTRRASTNILIYAIKNASKICYKIRFEKLTRCESASLWRFSRTSVSR